MTDHGHVCLDCPVWAWDEQPVGAYGYEQHPLGFGDLVEVHAWRGARLVPVAEYETFTASDGEISIRRRKP